MFDVECLMFVLSQFQKWAGFVKFSHTVFALPFALASMIVAARDRRGWPGWRLFALILAAMVCARTCAMSFNRIVDRRFDKANPRTADRHLPAGRVSLVGAWILWHPQRGGLVVVSYFINRICFFSSPVALFVVCFYSLPSGFSDFTHVFSGVARRWRRWRVARRQARSIFSRLKARLARAEKERLLPLILSVAVVFWLVASTSFMVRIMIRPAPRPASLVVRWGRRMRSLRRSRPHGDVGVLACSDCFRVSVAYLVGMVIIWAACCSTLVGGAGAI